MQAFTKPCDTARFLTFNLQELMPAGPIFMVACRNVFDSRVNASTGIFGNRIDAWSRKTYKIAPDFSGTLCVPPNFCHSHVQGQYKKRRWCRLCTNFELLDVSSHLSLLEL